MKQRKIFSFRASSSDQMGFYDYSFNNNYILLQNPPSIPSSYNNFEYSPVGNSAAYPEYNSLPSYNHFPPASSPIFGSNYRHTSAPNLPETSKFAKPETSQASNSDSISLEKLHSIIHNTSEHVHELNQMCQIKETKEFDKNLSSKLAIWLII